MMVDRTLPNRGRRMVGAWCFLDHYGPEDVAMRVPPHPHTGLQTVSWLFAGAVRHRDSLGNDQLIQPGQLNLMTAGRGIAHAEDSPEDHSGVLHGVQLWVALPDADRRTDPDFAHHGDLPVTSGDGLTLTVFVGELAGAASPARAYSPLLGAEAVLAAGAHARLPLVPGFEYAVLAVSGTVRVDGVELSPGPLLYLGTGRAGLDLDADRPARVLVLGGEPFDGQIVMWWNFVGRDHEDIVADRTDWMAGQRFGAVRDYPGDPLPAPAMPATRLKARGRQR
jgi:redox-sensitive bicupin YhaK (pirin superfamily)